MGLDRPGRQNARYPAEGQRDYVRSTTWGCLQLETREAPCSIGGTRGPGSLTRPGTGVLRSRDSTSSQTRSSGTFFHRRHRLRLSASRVPNAYGGRGSRARPCFNTFSPHQTRNAPAEQEEQRRQRMPRVVVPAARPAGEPGVRPRSHAHPRLDPVPKWAAHHHRSVGRQMNQKKPPS